MNWLKKNLVSILMGLAFIFGLGMLLYPSLSDYWNAFHQSRAIASYTANVSRVSREEYDKAFEEARDYNAGLARSGILWEMSDEELERYESELDMTGNGVMGYIDIAKIDVTLPVCHGTDEAVLQKAVGHIEGSSLPVGGVSTHTVLSGHRGLPSARLFTDLDKLEVGDTWTLHILDETLTYEADQIRIVRPSDLSELRIDEGEDYCTLVTCTPYGINTHRLLVRGHRIANISGEARVVADALLIEPLYIAPFVVAPFLLLLAITFIVTAGIEKRMRRRVLSFPAQGAKNEIKQVS